MLQPFSDFFISFFLSCLHGILLIISSTSYKYYLFVFKLFVSDTVLVHISSPKHLDRCGFFSIKFRNSKKYSIPRFLHSPVAWNIFIRQSFCYGFFLITKHAPPPGASFKASLSLLVSCRVVTFRLSRFVK